MSALPKPTTREQEFGEQIFCWKCGRPYHTADRECPNCGGRNLTPDLCAKPTGEWTVERIIRYTANISRTTAEMLADDINASTDAEHVVYERLEKSVLDLSHPNFKMLTDQLTAEREKLTLATQMVQIESKRANEAEQKVQTLVDALRKITKLPFIVANLVDVSLDALEKVEK